LIKERIKNYREDTGEVGGAAPRTGGGPSLITLPLLNDDSHTGGEEQLLLIDICVSTENLGVESKES